MGIRLSNVLGATAQASIEFGGEGSLEITYRPGAITPASLARLQEAAATEADGTTSAQIESVKLIVCFLADVLTSWNLLAEDDSPIGTDLDALEQLPFELLARVFAAVNGSGNQLGEAVAS
jgi:hypothetical protein